MGPLSLPARSSVYLDTSVFIYPLEQFPAFTANIQSPWNEVAQSELRVVTSEPTVLEVLVGPLQSGD